MIAKIKEKLQEIWDKALEKTLGLIMHNIKSGATLSEHVKTGGELVDNLLTDTIAEVVNAIDEDYASKRNKKVFIKYNSNKVKNILTCRGNVEMKRTQWKNKETGETFFFVDEVLDIDRYQRLDKDLQKTLMEDSVNRSYRVASARQDYRVSHQTAYNVIKRNVANCKEYPEEIYQKRSANKIYIEADEAHLSMDGGGNKICKLVYVHEGYKNVDFCSYRYELKHKMCFSEVEGYDIWKTVKDYIKRVYPVGVGIEIHGDGAAWIKAGLRHFPQAKFYLDKFHAAQAVVRLAGSNKKLQEELFRALNENDKEFLVELYTKKKVKFCNATKSAKSLVYLKYLIDNFDGIRFADTNKKCSAEAQVSHILADRLTRRGMSWSVPGAERIAFLRCMMENKIDFKTFVNVNDGLLRSLIGECVEDNTKENEFEEIKMASGGTLRNRPAATPRGGVPVGAIAYSIPAKQFDVGSLTQQLRDLIR